MIDDALNAADYSFMRRSRIAAVQVLYQVEFYNYEKPLEQIFNEIFAIYEEQLPDKPKEKILNKDLIIPTVETAIKEKKSILERVERSLNKEQDVNEMQMHLNMIIRLAISEVMNSNTDLPIILNEYIEIAKIFENDKDAKFLNSVVEEIGKEIRKI